MRRMAMMALCTVGLVACPPSFVRAAAPLDPPSNVEMLRGLIARATTEMLGDLPAPPAGASLQVRAAAPHPSNWLIEQAIAEHLARRGLHPRLTPASDSLAPPGDSLDAVLEYRAVDVALDYVRSRVAMNSGQKYVTRAARATVSARLLQPGSGAVLWARDGAARSQDEVADELLRGLGQPAAPVNTQPTVPVARLTRYTEPLLITVIVGGLIALFYANK